MDFWNYAGVRPDALREYDGNDVEKFFPPTSRYVIIFFPHRDPLEPDYWPPPYNRDYSRDFRPPLTETETWHMKIYAVYDYARDINIFWNIVDTLPGDYRAYLVTSTNDTCNIVEETNITCFLSSGVHRWKFVVQPSFYTSLSVYPQNDTIRVGEAIYFRAYLKRDTDSIRVARPIWSFSGTGGYIGSSGRFFATAPGTGFVRAYVGGMVDSTRITITEGSGFFINVHRGWNLIALPAQPFSNRANDIIPGSSLFLYEYSPTSRDYIITDSMIVGKGYFFLSFIDTIYNINGIAVDTIATALYEGWNMIGGPSAISHIFRTTPSSLIMSGPFIWNRIDYEEVDSIAPGRGCWILGAGAGSLVITNH